MQLDFYFSVDSISECDILQLKGVYSSCFSFLFLRVRVLISWITQLIRFHNWFFLCLQWFFVAFGWSIMTTLLHVFSQESERMVSRDEGIALASQYGCVFLECSAKTGENSGKCFEELALKVHLRNIFLDFAVLDLIHWVIKGSDLVMFQYWYVASWYSNCSLLIVEASSSVLEKNKINNRNKWHTDSKSNKHTQTKMRIIKKNL